MAKNDPFEKLEALLYQLLPKSEKGQQAAQKKRLVRDAIGDLRRSVVIAEPSQENRYRVQIMLRNGEPGDVITRDTTFANARRDWREEALGVISNVFGNAACDEAVDSEKKLEEYWEKIIQNEVDEEDPQNALPRILELDTKWTLGWVIIK